MIMTILEKSVAFCRATLKVNMLFLVFFSSMLAACSSGSIDKKNDKKTYEVQRVNIHKKLFFTGTMQPLGENTLTNQMDAVIETIHFPYGQRVKKGDIVYTLNSADLQKQYNEVLTDYLKAKDSFTIAHAKFNGTEDLWQAGLIAKNNYVSEKSSLNIARVALMQATHKLTDMLEKMGEGDKQNLSALSFDEFDKVRLALTSKHNLIYLKASSDGVLLSPPKANDDKTGRLTVGAAVKSGQVLALIGDLSGIRVEIDVPEVDIDKIKPGMPAIVHSVAFPNDALKGELVAINAQASTSSSGALPSFTAIVEVKSLSPSQQGWVKVGMSASIELAAENSDKLMVPISAVKQQHGQSIVQVRAKDGHVQERVITTGAAEADKVAVDSGLKAGDVVLYG